MLRKDVGEQSRYFGYADEPFLIDPFDASGFINHNEVWLLEEEAVRLGRPRIYNHKQRDEDLIVSASAPLDRSSSSTKNKMRKISLTTAVARLSVLKEDDLLVRFINGAGVSVAAGLRVSTCPCFCWLNDC